MRFRRFLPSEGAKNSAVEAVIPVENDGSASTEMQQRNKEDEITEVTRNAETGITVPADEEAPSEDAQDGVRRAEAMTLQWSKNSLRLVYILMWFMYFINAFQSGITSDLSAYVLSAFQSHSLVPVISIVSNIMSGVFYLPIAKMLDLWGRSGGFAVMTAISTLGLILMATCSNVETYGAAQVFYSVGFTGMIYTVDVITSDTSTLNNRGLAFAFTSSPYIITALAGPAAAQGFYYKISWRWAYGCFAIILPIMALPLFLIMHVNINRAKKNGLLARPKSGRNIWQSVVHYAVEFDILGVFLLAAGMTLFLLPFSIAVSSDKQWKSPGIIVMIVLGFLLLVTFAVTARYTKKPFIPYKLLISRNLLGACLLDATYQIAYYCWDSYFDSYLQVVYGLSIAEAGYVSGVFDIVSGVWLLFVGFLIRKTHYYRWLLLIAVPFYILSIGLLIYFRTPHTNIGYVIMCQVFIALSGGTMIIGQQIAVLATSEHGDVAAVLALLGLFGFIGGAIGDSISGAIWTNTLPKALQNHLPASAVADWETIYDDITVQLSYAKGTAVRDAIIEAYAMAQTRMLIAGVAIMSLGLVWVLMLKNIKLTDVHQTKGMAF